MAVDIVTRQEHGAPLSIERLDLNFENAREALDDLYVKFAAGIRIQSLAATEDGAGLVMTVIDESVLGPIPFPMATSRLRGSRVARHTSSVTRSTTPEWVPPSPVSRTNRRGFLNRFRCRPLANGGRRRCRWRRQRW